MDKSKKKPLKTFIYPGVECVVISVRNSIHFFPTGTVVKVLELEREGVWKCVDNWGMQQIVEAKDLVVVE